MGSNRLALLIGFDSLWVLGGWVLRIISVFLECELGRLWVRGRVRGRGVVSEGNLGLF
jgi:hypothetical protein